MSAAQELPDEPATEPDPPPSDRAGRAAGADPEATADRGRVPAQTGSPAAQPATQPWPLGHSFGRTDKYCVALLAFVVVFGLVMIAARPMLLTHAPLLLVALTGSRSAMVACGALAATTGLPWIAPLVLGTVSVVKFDLVYWWAGKLWGEAFIASMVTQTDRGRRRAKRAEAMARKFDVWAIGLTYIPYVPVPAGIIYAVLGTAGTSLRRFLAISLSWALLAQSIYLYLGYTIGEPVVQFLDSLAKYAWYLTAVLVVFVVWTSVRASRRDAKVAEGGAAAAEDDEV
ncbi:MAG: hypothetical protein CSA58_06510 [Micrococcales bacterium]|nr:MAG: hypothetical protein CSA58_06510 [Micrococcales bacterium]